MSAQPSVGGTSPRAGGAMNEDAAFQRLVAAAAQRYRPAGAGAYHFCKGKLGRDPVFEAILRQGLIADNARLVDLGCGQGVLLTLLAVVQEPALRDQWPAHLPPLPQNVSARGVDLRADAIAAARVALGAGAPVSVGDVRDASLEDCNTAVILDVLHYIDFDAQRALLARVFAALPPGGRFILRAGDGSKGAVYKFTLVTDWLITLVRGSVQRKFWARRGDEWLQLVREVGFRAEMQQMDEGTPFANVLVIAQRP